ncbi:ribosome maturation factor RimP [Leadbetterella byssophila]|uniref:ribosome maturation factor RimP n=1 Tax=Leadbetterella byssophila TaxID=316068 RepID=UPI0039A0D19E
MSLKDTVIKLVEDLIRDTDYYIVEIAVSDSKIRRKVSIFLDSDAGITIDQCTEVSRKLGLQLEEVIDEAFTLEVSSPGADSPLKFERQYVKNIGRSLKILKVDGSEIKGKLVSVENGSITIETEAKKKVKSETVALSLDEIKEAKVIISFK